MVFLLRGLIVSIVVRRKETFVRPSINTVVFASRTVLSSYSYNGGVAYFGRSFMGWRLCEDIIREFRKPFPELIFPSDLIFLNAVETKKCGGTNI